MATGVAWWFLSTCPIRVAFGAAWKLLLAVPARVPARPHGKQRHRDLAYVAHPGGHGRHLDDLAHAAHHGRRQRHSIYLRVSPSWTYVSLMCS